MAINFTDSPANGATQVVGGRTYTYNSAKNKWDTTATEVTGPTATVYANVDALPTSGNITGAQAYVSGNNRLYIWNGTGWYNIALINTAPSISGVNSSYALAIDGTATTVTITASDPEGLPITYSIASDTSGNIATVTQSSNVFTITPSTSEANAGTFSLTFRASDGVNLATAVSEFTLAFRVTNSNYTTSLITTNGSTGINTTFTDSSSNSHTVTANGNVNQSSFSPYRSGGYSTYFDGSGDYIDTNSAIDLSSGGCIEGWVYETGGTNYSFFIASTQGAGSFVPRWYVGHTNAGDWRVSPGDATDNNVTAYDFVNNQWNHFVLSNDGSTSRLFANGVLIFTKAVTPVSENVTFTLSKYGPTANYYMMGYLSDIRVTSSIPTEYQTSSTTVGTSVFTPPTGRLSVETDTKLLTCHLPYLADGSTNGYTITPSGNVATKPFGPYDYQEYVVGDHGGSAYFDGSGDYLSVPDSDDWHIGASDFTIEGWIYKANDGSHQSLLSNRASGSNEWRVILDYTTAYNEGSFRLDWGSSYNTWSNADIQADTWTHFAVTRSGTTGTLYINGVSKGDKTLSDIGNISGPLILGSNDGSGEYYKGNVSDLKITKGAVNYTTDFTPPTSPLTSDENTSILLNMQGAVILDKSQTTPRVILVGNTTASTTQYKYLPSSIYFDGADDGIRIPMASGVGATARLPGSFEANEDFTIEMWHYLTARTEAQPCLFSNYSSFSAGDISLFAGHGNSNTTQYQVAVNGTFPAINAGTINYNQWVHVALVRSSGTITLYIDGTSVGTVSNNTALLGDGNWMGIGFSQDNTSATSINGYLSDVRITKGLARYTANFTPPSAALDG